MRTNSYFDGKTALYKRLQGWIKVALGVELGLGPGHMSRVENENDSSDFLWPTNDGLLSEVGWKGVVVRFRMRSLQQLWAMSGFLAENSAWNIRNLAH